MSDSKRRLPVGVNENTVSQRNAKLLELAINKVSWYSLRKLFATRLIRLEMYLRGIPYGARLE